MSQPPPADPALALYLAERDIPCPNPACGFNLRGLSGSACPECGHELQIGLRGPGELFRVRAWVYALALSTTVAMITYTVYTCYNTYKYGAYYRSDWADIAYDVLSVLLAVYSCVVLGVFAKRAGDKQPLPMSRLLVLFVGAVVAHYALLSVMIVWAMMT